VVPRSTGEQVPLYNVILERERFWDSIGMPIRTPQLTLRPMWPEDARALTRIVTQEAVAKMLFLFSSDWDDADAFIDSWAYVGDLHFRLAIVHEGKFIGSIGVGEGREPTTFYFLDPAVAGKGVATEAVAAFTDFLFARFDIDALTPDVFADNPASMRVLEKCGYKAVGRGEAKSAARLEPAPIVHYRLDRKDHAAR
jgi:RimJ/RimL family protein N-acetyltransferase